MKNIFLILFFTATVLTAKSQDKIITLKNDTIDCRIVSANAERIVFEQKISENRTIGKSIAASEVLQYYRSARSDNSINLDFHKDTWEHPENRWLFSLQGGASHSFNKYSDFRNLLISNGNSDSEANDYIRKLKNGYFVNPYFHFLVTNFLGIGADYSYYHSEAEGEFIVKAWDVSGHNIPFYNTLTQDEKMFVHFAGGSILLLQNLGENKKIRLSENISPGIVFFRDESRSTEYQEFWGSNDHYAGQVPHYYDYANAVSTSKSFGLKGGLSLEYRISPKFSTCITGNIVFSKLHKISINSSKYDIENQDLEIKINISRLDYGISIRYNL